jgi:hypothetical protein
VDAERKGIKAERLGYIYTVYDYCGSFLSRVERIQRPSRVVAGEERRQVSGMGG